MASDTVATTTPTATTTSETAYHDLRRLIPSLAAELNSLRTSLREHDLWILRYGHDATTGAPSSASHGGIDMAEPQLPLYTPSDLPGYDTGVPAPTPASAPAPQPSTRDSVEQGRDQIISWLREGEDVLREYSARFSQLGEELQMPFEDVLGTWAESNPDNALPGYNQIEERAELMVGGVGEVPPPYIRGVEKTANTTTE